MPVLLRPLAALVFALCVASAAAAHVMLSAPEAAAGSAYTASFRVTHGCGGSATTALRVEIPKEVAAAKPQAKAGWTIEIEHAAGEKGGGGDGEASPVGRVSAIIWRGGVLPNDEWDEFGISAKLPNRTGPLYFPVVQTCEIGVVNWSDVPAPGQAWRSVRHPAPMVMLKAASAPAMAMTEHQEP